jgi:hypothetical protein
MLILQLSHSINPVYSKASYEVVETLLHSLYTDIEIFLYSAKDRFLERN